MKKIIYIFLALVLLSTSCSTNQKQQNVIDTDNIVASDLTKLAAYLNLYLRSLSAGSSIYYTEIASDFVDPGLGYGNRGGAWYRWEWTSETEIGIWPTCYSGIGQANFIIQEADKLDKSTLTDEELEQLNDDLALAYFTKAFLGAKLLFYYTPLYTTVYGGTVPDPEDANDEDGVIIQDEFAPSGDISSFKPRSSLVASYKWVFDNLQTAKDMLPVSAAVGSTTPTKDACDALKARLALHMGDNATAATLAASLVNSGKYPLVDDIDAFEDAFVYDSGDECIMQFYAEYSASLPGTYDPGYISYSTSTRLFTPDWLPSNALLAFFLSGTGDDFRLDWFTVQKVTYSGVEGTVPLLAKFPGNPALQAATATQSSYLHKPKPFRIAEQYLIAAEAYALSGAETLANQFLQALQSKRDPSYVEASYSGDELVKQIRDERARELVGEGFRFFDLKRYGKGMTRKGCFDPTVTNVAAGNASALTMTVSANDYRWTQPIPQSEIDANPKCRQNKGYTIEVLE